MFLLRWVLLVFLAADRALREVRFWLHSKMPEHLTAGRLPKWDEKLPVHGEAAWAALCLMDELANATGAKVFPISGTLLGLYRNGELLAHDYDIDLGVFADDPSLGKFVEAVRSHPGVVISGAVSIGPVERLLNPWLAGLHRDTLLYKVDMAQPGRPELPPVRADLFVHVEAHGYVAHGSTRSIWLNSPISLSRRVWNGVKFWVPNDIERYLRENYGLGFIEEQRDFISALDCPNVTNMFSFAGARFAGKLTIKARTSGASARRLRPLAKRRFRRFVDSMVSGRLNWTIDTGA